MGNAHTDTIAVTHMDSPVGPLTLVATTTGLRRISFGTFDAEELARDLHADLTPDSTNLERARRELEEYFAGTRTAFGIPLDLRTGSAFVVDVLTAMGAIPYGSRRSYAELAEESGHAGAARAVGSACRRNPLPLVIPCHRVVSAGGGVGSYAGGTQAKRWLLDLEAAHA